MQWQLQFVKKELLEAMQAIDELFNANQVRPSSRPLSIQSMELFKANQVHARHEPHFHMSPTAFCTPSGTRTYSTLI